MKYILTLLMFVIPNIAVSKTGTLKVAVVDTGFDFKSKWDRKIKDVDGLKIVKPRLCEKGHKDFTNTSLKDTHGHGTHIAGTIAKYAKDADYCLIIIKTYDSGSNINNSFTVVKAIKYAITLNVDIINYSGGGVNPMFVEREAVKEALDKGIIIVAAAGNEKTKIDFNILKMKKVLRIINDRPVLINEIFYINRKTSKVTTENQKGYYPATYDPRIIAVSNIARDGTLNKVSNHGDAVVHKEIGTKVLSILPNNLYGHMHGTSQAAAIKTGKIIKNW
ncbi:MAG: S8 family peptidase [Candidatus Njordarchaeales archaeon]